MMVHPKLLTRTKVRDFCEVFSGKGEITRALRAETRSNWIPVVVLLVKNIYNIDMAYVLCGTYISIYNIYICYKQTIPGSSHQ